MRTEAEEHSPPVATGCVDRAVLAPHHKVVHVAQRKGHGGDGHCFALLEHQLQTVLQGEHTQPQTNQLMVMTAHLYNIHTSLTYLWLGEHVEAPGAHFAIGGNADQVVSILGSYHVHTVDRVLNTAEHSQRSETTCTYQPDVSMQRTNRQNAVCVDIKMCDLLCITVCAAADRGVL